MKEEVGRAWKETVARNLSGLIAELLSNVGSSILHKDLFLYSL
jgi:hypothetical protein